MIKYHSRLKHLRDYRPDTAFLLVSRFMVVVIACLPSICQAADYYVATNGNDTHPGSKTEPWKTIQHAADTLQPGDTVYIRGGVYRECVQPGRGGTSEDKRITFKAYPGEILMIKGSEPISTWQEQGNNVWKAVIPDTFFGEYNNVLIDKTIGSKSSRLVLAHNLFVNSGLTYAGIDGRGMPVWVPHTLNVAGG